MKHFSEEFPNWHYTEPAPLNTKILLLTPDNQCVVGVWKGPQLGGPAPAPGEAPQGKFKAWAGMPKRDKNVESALGWR